MAVSADALLVHSPDLRLVPEARNGLEMGVVGERVACLRQAQGRPLMPADPTAVHDWLLEGRNYMEEWIVEGRQHIDALVTRCEKAERERDETQEQLETKSWLAEDASAAANAAERRVAELETALRPFVIASSAYVAEAHRYYSVNVKGDDVQAARAALEGGSE